NGIANGAALKGYSVAGKTGTAQIPSEDGRYVDDAYISSFAGFVPAEDPRMVVVIVLERPQSKLLGTVTAMDAFRGIAIDALRDQRDGHDFAADAFARGARAAVVERPVEGVPDGALVVEVTDALHALRRLADALRDAHPIPAVGITGNVGKTTTKEATAAAL